jgi:hypothetical protein
VLLPLIFIFYKKSEYQKKVKEKEKTQNADREKLFNEIEILKENQELQKKEAEEKQEKLSNDIEKEKIDLIEKYTKAEAFTEEYAINLLTDSFTYNTKYYMLIKNIDKLDNPQF